MRRTRGGVFGFIGFLLIVIIPYTIRGHLCWIIC